LAPHHPGRNGRRSEVHEAPDHLKLCREIAGENRFMMSNPAPQFSDHLKVRVHPTSQVVPSHPGLIVRKHAKALRFPDFEAVAGSEDVLPKCELEFVDHFAGSSVNGAHIL